MKIINRKQARKRGLKRYFTGKPCVNGHLSERTLDCACVECCREKNARYKRDPAREREIQAKYRGNNKGTIARKNRKYYADNKESRVKNQRVYSQKERDELGDVYIKSTLRSQFPWLSTKDISPEIVEQKRNHISAFRVRKKIREALSLGGENEKFFGNRCNSVGS